MKLKEIDKKIVEIEKEVAKKERLWICYNLFLIKGQN